MRELTVEEIDAVTGATSAADAWIGTGTVFLAVGTVTSETGLGIGAMAIGAGMIGIGVGLDIVDATGGGGDSANGEDWNGIDARMEVD
jgi:hypothetical protein